VRFVISDDLYSPYELSIYKAAPHFAAYFTTNKLLDLELRHIVLLLHIGYII